MIPCPECGKEIVEGAILCKHCGAKLGDPKRPTGVTVIAVLTFIVAALELYEISSANRMTSLILGIKVPVGFYQFFGLLGVGLAIYCGIGFLNLKDIARKIYLYWAIYSVANTIITQLVMLSGMRIRYEVLVIMMIGLLIDLGLYGYILYYLVRRKDYFMN